jgi:hypothetical protein
MVNKRNAARCHVGLSGFESPRNAAATLTTPKQPLQRIVAGTIQRPRRAALVEQPRQAIGYALDQVERHAVLLAVGALLTIAAARGWLRLLSSTWRDAHA